jgi:transcriptional regulator with XRE-family HTH domain
MPGVERIRPKRPRMVYLAEWRDNKKLTQKQLAERLGVTSMTVSRWERAVRDAVHGKAKPEALPNTNVLAAIAEALGIEPEDLHRHPDHISLDAMLRGQPAKVREIAIARIIEATRRAS